MNGRIYDPTLGRFLQADPHIQAPTNSQNYNRYSYVLNNPMSYTDPSGFFFKKLFKKINKALGDFAPIVAIGLAFLGQTWAAQGIWQAATLGFVSGGIATGSLRGALVGAFSGAAFFEIGAHFTGALEGGFGHVMAHGITGGLSSVLQGGKFGHGFISAGLTKALNINKMVGVAAKDAGLRIVSAAVIGGTISKISGGKFANGAVTSAFAQALNGEQGAAEKRRQDRLARSRVSTTMSTNDETNEHVYKISGKICDASAEGCNAALADKVYDEVNNNDIPFTDDDLREGRHYLTPLDDPITHRQSTALRTSVNIAEEGHTFYPGTVTHQVHFRDGALYYDLTGVGTGQLPAFNNHVGEFLFRPGVVSVVRNHGF